MSKIPKPLLAELLADPFYTACARRGLGAHECVGRVTFEHAIVHAGKQLQKKFAIVPLCEKAHSVNTHQDGGDLNKEVNLWIALNRATPMEIYAISKAVDYFHELGRLNTKYGVYVSPLKPLPAIAY